MAEWPTTPEPPVRLTTLKGCLSSFSNTAATMRAVASVPPPAPHGQTMVTGRLGQACARAAPSPSVAAAPAAPLAASTSRRVYVLMGRLLLALFDCRKHSATGARVNLALRMALSPNERGQGDGKDDNADRDEIQRAHLRAEEQRRQERAERRREAAEQAHAADGQVAQRVVGEDVDAHRHHE